MEGFMICGGTLSSPGEAASTNPRLGLHTVRGGVDPRDRRFISGLLEL